MNQTPDSYAYRCLPLSIANTHGWEVRCPVTCEAEWNGGFNKEDVQIKFEDRGNSFLGTKKIKTLVESHFGSGILTFNVGVIISTCPGYDLWVTGPVNEFKDGNSGIVCCHRNLLDAVHLYNELEIHKTEFEGEVREG